MTEPGRVHDHAQRAGCATLADYALELEDVLEGIVTADRSMAWTYDPHDMHAALMRAKELVDSWDIRP